MNTALRGNQHLVFLLASNFLKNGRSTAGMEAAIPSPARGFSTVTWERNPQGCENTSSWCGHYSGCYWGLSELCLWNEFNSPPTDTIPWWFFILCFCYRFTFGE